jgi:hypothetical protein
MTANSAGMSNAMARGPGMSPRARAPGLTGFYRTTNETNAAGLI